MGGASTIRDIAGHGSVKITEEHTFVDLERQCEA